jgi:hypothetical protein
MFERRRIRAEPLPGLPVQYFHVVFTIPAQLHALFLAAPRPRSPSRRLRAKIAFTAILHTWTQFLLFHPHLHCIVPGGGRPWPPA